MAQSSGILKVPAAVLKNQYGANLNPADRISRLPCEILCESFKQCHGDQTSSVCLALCSKTFTQVAVQSKIDCSKVKKWSVRGNSWVPSAARYCEICGKYQLEMCNKWSSTEWHWIKGLYKDIYKTYGSHKFTRYFGRSAWFDFELSRDQVPGGFACPKHPMVTRSDVMRRIFHKDQGLIQILQDIDIKPAAIYLVSFMLQLQWFSHWELFDVMEEGSPGDDLVQRRNRELKTMYKVFEEDAAFSKDPGQLAWFAAPIPDVPFSSTTKEHLARWGHIIPPCGLNDQGISATGGWPHRLDSVLSLKLPLLGDATGECHQMMHASQYSDRVQGHRCLIRIAAH